MSIMDGRSWVATVSALGRNWLWFLPLPLVAAFLVGPMFPASFGPIDDHEIPALLSPTGHLGWDSVPGTIARLVASYDTNRWRPVFWVVRVTELALWGANANGWYLDRLVLLLATMVGASALALRYVGGPLAAFAAFLVVAGPQAESWYRLGPQEAIGMPLLLIGVALIAWGRARSGLVLVVLAALCKESFIPFALAACLLAWRTGSPVSGSVASAATLAAGAWTAYVHLKVPDFYGQARSLGEVSNAVLQWFVGWWNATRGPLIVVAGVAIGWRPRWELVTAGVILVCAEAYLYAGIQAGRYFMPVGLVVIAAAIGSLSYMSRKSVVLAAALAVVIAASALGALDLQRTIATIRSGSARQWNAGIAELRGVLASDPSATIVIVPRRVWNYEPLFSLRRFVPEGQAMVAPAALDAVTALEKDLRRQLADVSENGWTDSIAPGITFAPWMPSRDCVAVVFEGSSAPGVCPRTVSIPVR